MPATRLWNIQNSMFLPDFSAQNMVRDIEGKLYRNDLRGDKNYFVSVSFELSMVKLQ